MQLSNHAKQNFQCAYLLGQGLPGIQLLQLALDLLLDHLLLLTLDLLLVHHLLFALDLLLVLCVQYVSVYVHLCVSLYVYMYVCVSM